MKKILIFTVSAGNGHNSAAKAVHEKAKSMGGEVKTIDLLKEMCDDKFFIWLVQKGYPLAVTYLRNTYNAFYRFYQKSNPDKANKLPVQANLIKMHDKVLKEIYEFKPDAIYCTHFYPGIIISNLRKKYEIPAQVYSFIFDYSVCPFWEASTGIDKLLIPNDDYIEQMCKKGFKKEQLLSYGLTVNDKFSNEISKNEAREKLGLSNDVFTIFVIFGGGLWSGNYSVIKNLSSKIKDIPLQIIVANGKDKKGKENIDKLKMPPNIKILNFGFSNEVDLLMSAADLIIGKAGGVGITESLNKRVPIIIGKKLPEQESFNAKLLVENNVAKQYKNPKEMIAFIRFLVKNPDELKLMRDSVEKFRKPQATVRLCEEMLKVDADYSKIETVKYDTVNKTIRKNLIKRNQKKVVKKKD